MKHLELARLFDYWAAALDGDAEAAVEEHAFQCDECARLMTAIGQLAHGIMQTVARRGGIALVATRSLLDQLERDGVVLRNYEARLGETVHCGVGASDDLVVTVIKTDLTGIENVGFELFAGSRRLTGHDDVPIDRAGNQLIYTLAGDLVRSTQFEDFVRGGPPPPTGTKEVLPLVARFFTREAAGERALGEVVFMHTSFSYAPISA